MVTKRRVCGIQSIIYAIEKGYLTLKKTLGSQTCQNERVLIIYLWFPNRFPAEIYVSSLLSTLTKLKCGVAGLVQRFDGLTGLSKLIFDGRGRGQHCLGP